MLHYIVDGKEVRLSADTSVDFYSRNPLLTKEGQYTLDIDIDMRDSQNASIYGYCYRLDKDDIPSNRHATLFDERGIIITGKEIVLEVAEEHVKVQVIGGVSELNNMLNSGLTLHDLTPDNTKYYIDDVEYHNVATTIIASGFTNYAAVHVPCIFNTEALEEESSFCVPIDKHNTGAQPQSHDYGMSEGTAYSVSRAEAFCLLPWLWYVTEAVLDALGFDVTYNHIKEDNTLQRVVVVQRNLNIGTNILYTLPDWDVSTFITEVEKFCNVIIVPGTDGHSVEIVSIPDYYDRDANNVVIAGDDIIGKVGKKTDNDADRSDIVTLYDNVRYAFPSTNQYKYLCVDDGVMAVADIKECQDLTSDTAKRMRVFNVWREIKGNWNFETDIKSAEAENEYRNGNHIFYDPALDMQFVLKFQEEKEIEIYNDPVVPYGQKVLLQTIEYEDSYYLQHINSFRGVINDKEADAMEMKIVPCEMAVRNTYKSITPLSLSERPLPCLRNKEDIDNVEFYIFGEDNPNGENTINNEILNGIADKTIPENIFVGLYFGTFGDHAIQMFPVVAPTNRMVVYRNETGLPDCNTAEVVIADNREQHMTLELQGADGLYANNYSKNALYDINNEYTIRFHCVNRPDPRSVFIIHNKKFICKELKYSTSDCRVSDICEGVFYPIK